jgi:acyl-CoA synthetase (NDP forming)
MSWPDALFRPRGVAVVGSVGEGKIGRVLIDQLLDGGFPRVYAVNPKGEGTVGSRTVPAGRSFRELADAGSPIDLAVVASPASTVAGVLEDAGKSGVKAAILITAGFSESGNSEQEQALVRTAERFGLRLVGPNCAGIVNTKHDLFPALETKPPIGDVAFVSQSGALGGAVLSWAEEQGVGFSKFVSYGNGADLTDVDFLDVLREDDESRVVCLYIETVSDGRAFLDAAARLTAVKPLIVIKAGRSTAGRRAALSHTGSMAGADAVFDAAFAQCGALRVDGIEEMFDLCRGFTTLSPVRGKRIAIVTNSGGPGVLVSDRSEDCGLAVQPASPALRSKLAEKLPSFCSFDNPFDLTVQGGENEYRDTIVAVANEYDVILALNVNVPYLDVAPLARGVADAARAIDVPVAASFLAGRTVASALPILAEGGVPNFATGERAVRVLALMAERERGVEGRCPSTSWLGSQPLDSQQLPWTKPPLEPEAMDWLESLGVPIIDRQFARSADEAVAAADRLGYPVVVKVVSRVILHKTDVGGVVLDLSDADAVRAAFERFSEIGNGRGFEGVLVSRMIRDPVEAIVGLSRDPQFGPIVAVGLGGIHTEVLKDIALRIAPIDEAQALAAIGELRGAPILRGLRGASPLDVEALASLAATISELGVRFPDLAELDLNPVFVLERGCAVADARVIVSLSPEDPTDDEKE